MADVDYSEYFAYLNGVRRSGKINMFGVAPYLAEDFDLPIREAREILAAWMKSFDDGEAA